MSLGYLVLQGAHEDIRTIQAWSRKQFGLEASRRYSKLIRKAFSELQFDPARNGARRDIDFPPGYLRYHLHHVDQGSVGNSQSVQRPRHYVIFSVRNQTVIIHRILHDSMDLPEHIT